MTEVTIVRNVIVRNPFGITGTEGVARWDGGDAWEKLKSERLRAHLEQVGDGMNRRPVGFLRVVTRLSDLSSPGYDGRKAEWVSVVEYDNNA